MSNPSTVGRPMEILLVEDSLVDARLTIGALEHGGFRHRLTLVRDGDEALEFIFHRGKFAQAPRRISSCWTSCCPAGRVWRSSTK